MNEIQIFNNPDFGEVRIVTIDGEPYFVGKDVAAALGYEKERNALQKHVDADDALKRGVLTNGGMQEMTVINESGLYSLIFGSKLDSAKKFKKWVTSEVLPSIRKTGGYGVPQTIPEQIQLLAQGNVEVNQRVDVLTDRIDKIESDLPILPLEAYEIEKVVRRKGVEVLGGKKACAYNDRSLRQKLYNDLYANLKHNFDVRTYKAIRRKDVEKAVQIVNEYKPPLFLAVRIEATNVQESLDLSGGNSE